MGKLVDGVWQKRPVGGGDSSGRFVRTTTTFRNWITSDGAPGPSGEGGFQAEAGRYHLYVSYACPWAHRTLIFRKLKGLENLISVSAVHPDMLDEGWTFETDFPGATGIFEQTTRLIVVISAAHERDRNEIHLQFGGQLYVRAIFVRQRRRRQAAALAIDSLVVRENTTDDDGRVDPRPFDIIDAEFDLTIVQEQDVTR